jgi:hypothetical protein
MTSELPLGFLMNFIGLPLTENEGNFLTEPHNEFGSKT